MSSSKIVSKHASRIGACQVMYQKEITGNNTQVILNNFIKYYLKEEPLLKHIQLNFFKRLVSYFDNTEFDTDEIIRNSLSENYSLERMQIMMKCIIKVAILEMKFEKTDIPVIINEYVQVSKYFVGQSEFKFVNAILDKISKNIERKCQEINQ